MKSGFDQSEINSLKYKRIIKQLGFYTDNKYDLTILKGVGAWLGNVNKQTFSLANIEPGGIIDTFIQNGAIIVSNAPFPLANGSSMSSQIGIYCANYQEVFSKLKEKEKESELVR